MREAPFKLAPDLVPSEEVEALVCYGFFPSESPRCSGRVGRGLLPLRLGAIVARGVYVFVCKYTQWFQPEFFFFFFNARSRDGVILPVKAFCSEAAFSVLQK